MKLNSITVYKLAIPLVSPFKTSFATQKQKICFLLKVECVGENGIVTGWGENVALFAPLYSPEYTDGDIDVTRRWLAPALFHSQDLTAESVTWRLKHVLGHRMAKASLEMAILDAQLRDRQLSFKKYLGGTVDSVPSGVSVGIQESIGQLLETVHGYLEQGYQRIKLKIEPGRDLDTVAAVRREFGYELPLQVDANAAYTLADANHLSRLDEYNLLLIEQPLGEDDIVQHSKLAALIKTPLCLDESIISAERAADAIALGAAQVINIKPGRVGGYLEAKRIHDIARANGIPVWHGGMLETGIGRAANAAMASLPGFSLPGDISGSNRFYEEDITDPIVMHDGVVDVPAGPGFGVEVRDDVLRKYITNTFELTPET